MVLPKLVTVSVRLSAAGKLRVTLDPTRVSPPMTIVWLGPLLVRRTKTRPLGAVMVVIKSSSVPEQTVTTGMGLGFIAGPLATAMVSLRVTSTTARGSTVTSKMTGSPKQVSATVAPLTKVVLRTWMGVTVAVAVSWVVAALMKFSSSANCVKLAWLPLRVPE